MKTTEKYYMEAVVMERHMSKTMDEEMNMEGDSFFEKEFTLTYNGKSVDFLICPEVWEMMEQLLADYKEILMEEYIY